MRINLTLIIQVANILAAVGVVRYFFVIPLLKKLMVRDEREALLRQEVKLATDKASSISDKASKELVHFQSEMQSVWQGSKDCNKNNQISVNVIDYKQPLSSCDSKTIDTSASKCAERLLNDLFKSV